MKFPHILIGMAAVTLLLGMPERTLAQDYDDDIYYNPSKPAVQQKKSKTIKYTPTPDYPAADTYSQPATAGTTTAMRDIDEYNRRGIFAPVDAADARVVNADTLDDFLYTRRIEAFHNPDVVTSTGNQDLIDYYYNQGYQQGLDDGTVTNITVSNYDPFWGPAYSWYGYPSWRWRVGYYDPWYWNSWAWGPSWSWGWGPSWAWGPSWGWGPSWHHGWHNHGWHNPGWNHGWSGNTAWRPSTGASRPHASTGAWSGHRASASRPSSSGGTASGFTRPGNMGRGRYTGNGTYTGSRPAQSSATSGNTSRPTQSYNSGNYGNRGRNNSGNNGSQTRSRSYDSSSSRSSSWSSGSNWGGNRGGGSSYGSGSGGGRSSGGGSYGGGGGGGRGRR